MNATEPITIVTVCDNQFAVLLAALLKSIESNYVSDAPIDLYIVNDNITETNIQKINKVIVSDKIKIIWKKLEEAIPPQLKLPLDNTTFPANTYARICIPHFIDQKATRAIYMDVDMILLKNVMELWQVDLEGYAVGAVADRSEVVGSPWGGIKNYKQLGLSPDSGYFNSGLLIIDTRKWRELKVAEKAFRCSVDNIEFVSFADQYSLNVIFNEKWKALDARWNSYAQGDIKDPFLIHFTGMKPIFKGYTGNAHYKDIFFSYLNQTPWSNFTAKSNLFRLLKKGINKIVKKTNRIVRRAR